MRLLITGGAGFIGSALIRHLLTASPHEIACNVDKLTYAGSAGFIGAVCRQPPLPFFKNRYLRHRSHQEYLCRASILTASWKSCRREPC